VTPPQLKRQLAPRGEVAAREERGKVAAREKADARIRISHFNQSHMNISTKIFYPFFSV
jgi:hypothetical protein